MAEVARPIFADSRARPSSARDFGQALGNDDARGSLDEGEVREGLREVAEVAAGFDVVLLGVQSKRGCHLREPLYQVSCPLRLIDDGQRRDEPERADDESPLHSPSSVCSVR
jgi:hypothetical protein